MRLSHVGQDPRHELRQPRVDTRISGLSTSETSVNRLTECSYSPYRGGQQEAIINMAYGLVAFLVIALSHSSTLGLPSF